MLDAIANTLLFREARLHRVQGKFADCLRSEAAEGFLDLLLNGMALMLLVLPEYRRNIEGFNGKYLLKSRDGSITVSATFAKNRMKVSRTAVADPNVTVTFKDDAALRNFLLSEQPDILNSILQQLIEVDGNLNYIYKLGYMANHLRLAITG